MESLHVRVWSVIHKTDDFYIFQAEPSDFVTRNLDRKVTCKGRLFGIMGITSGVPLELFGTWVFHPKFGQQFDVSGWAPWSDTSVGVESFLRHCIGILNEFQVSSLVDTFGTDTFRVLKEDPSRLVEAGFDAELSAQVLGAWNEAVVSSELSTFFADHGLTSDQMRGLYLTFGAEARVIVEANPYRLLEVDGFTFAKADEVAFARGLSVKDPRRFEGAVLWILREAASLGNLCVRRGDLSSQLRELIRTTGTDSFEEFDLSRELSYAVQRLLDRGGVCLDTSVGVYLPKYFLFERGSAGYLARFVTPAKLDVDYESFLRSYETIHHIKLSDAQRDAVEKLINNKVLVLTGLPGTGKTTVIRTLVELLDQAKVSFVLMAPTGIASKRLAAVTGRQAATIHRTFRYNGEEWGFHANNKYPIGAVIVDEMSMVDQELFYRIMSALNEDTILVFVGDDAQLPSVGPGNVLRELIRCSAIPNVRLTQIFRQSEQSDIILNSHRINRGLPIKSGGGKDSDFQFVPILDEDKIADLIVQMSMKLKGRDANFQVLSPKYDGTVGVTNLNDRLREVLNPPSPGKKEFTIEGVPKFREGDRIMVVRNDYELGVYNGDMGKLLQITSASFLVKIHGIGEDGLDVLVDIPRREALHKLKLAYAITVHKSQGSEFDTIILPIVRAHGRMLQRNLFYTAVTRAKKKVWLLGDSASVQRAIDNDKVVLRTTGFEGAILSAMASMKSESPGVALNS